MMKISEISDKVSSVVIVSDKLKAIISVLVNDLAQEDAEEAILKFTVRQGMYSNLLDIANDLNHEATSALETLMDALKKETPAQTKATGE